MDSNHDKCLQRALCYRYTIGQTAAKLASRRSKRKGKFLAGILTCGIKTQDYFDGHDQPCHDVILPLRQVCVRVEVEFHCGRGGRREFNVLAVRREKRLAQQKTELEKTGQTLPLVYTLLQRFTQATFKLSRWLRRPLASTHLATSSPAPATLPLRQTL